MYYHCGVLHTCHAHRSAKLTLPVGESSVHEGSRGGRRSRIGVGDEGLGTVGNSRHTY